MVPPSLDGVLTFIGDEGPRDMHRTSPLGFGATVGDSGSLGGEGTESAGLVRVRASKCGWRTCWKGQPP